MVEELLKEKDLKQTKQRKEVLNTINDLNDLATLKNIIDNCSNIDKSTIYRIIEQFLNVGLIIKKMNYEDKIYYSIKEKHSHYITCIKCHKKELIKCPINLSDEILSKYELLDHKVEVLGICLKCKNN